MLPLQIPFFYVHLLLTISVFYLPLFAYSMALDFGQLDAMCGDVTPTPEPVINGTGDASADDDSYMTQWHDFWNSFCGDRMYYELVGTICIFLQVCRARWC